MTAEMYSYYGLLADGSVALWDFLDCADQADAAKHADALAAENIHLAAVEVWSIRGFCFAVPVERTTQGDGTSAQSGC